MRVANDWNISDMLRPRMIRRYGVASSIPNQAIEPIMRNEEMKDIKEVAVWIIMYSGGVLIVMKDESDVSD